MTPHLISLESSMQFDENINVNCNVNNNFIYCYWIWQTFHLIVEAKRKTELSLVLDAQWYAYQIQNAELTTTAEYIQPTIEWKRQREKWNIFCKWVYHPSVKCFVSLANGQCSLSCFLFSFFFCFVLFSSLLFAFLYSLTF